MAVNIVGLGTVLVFLASTASIVFAECAWVLWDRNEKLTIAGVTFNESIRWEPRMALMSKDECEQAKKKAWLTMADSFNDVTKFPEVDKIEKTQNEGVLRGLKHGGHVEDTLICLPDTVNPRG
jgi:hypothetical protein